jgi:hypothetical protein
VDPSTLGRFDVIGRAVNRQKARECDKLVKSPRRRSLLCHETARSCNSVVDQIQMADGAQPANAAFLRRYGRRVRGWHSSTRGCLKSESSCLSLTSQHPLLISAPVELVCRVIMRKLANLCSFKHSSRTLPLKLSTDAYDTISLVPRASRPV